MIGKICGVICAVSFVFGAYSGSLGQMGSAVMDGASNAVELTVSLLGAMCLWNGILEVARVSGATRAFASLLSPFLRFLFPDTYRKNNGMGEIAASFTANIFGIGNAATPLAIGAMKKLQENNEDKTKASDDMVMFTVLGTASFDLFPTTLIALRRANGSTAPFEIIVPVWICSFATAFLGVLLVKIIQAKRRE